ncbi:unnamed protein product [Acanthosepion pharaonis]|uniref:CFAP74 second Ig-like domain-containing protein n=1 Tax=Acanthosepion pharaonis TaxID=158019 RepID=A0A812CXK3_ACAPH|nr:unnamed protein product [Sepia pharaonis]
MNKRIRKEKKKRELEKKQELEEREKIVQEGGNADIVMLLKQKQKKENQEKLMFERKQEENYQKIVKKLLLEDSLKKKDEKQQKALKKKQKRDFTRQKIGVQKAYPMTKKFEALLNSNFPENKEMKDKESSQNQESKPILQQELLLDSDEESEKEVAILKKQLLSEESADDEDGDLAAPEFEGMWYRQESNLNLETLKNVPKEGKHNQSKMEKEIMERQMEKLRNQTVEKKMLAGKELKGCSFYGKPDVIHFKNIDVGKTYKKKVVITNVSYTVNNIKLIGVSTSIQDFVQVEFTPPGQISAGMTCDLFVTFTPKLNEDLSGEVKFLSKTGKFSIPLKCTTKKCELSVDLTTVDFETTVIEDVLRKTITLMNNGALGTEFEFFSKYSIFY